MKEVEVKILEVNSLKVQETLNNLKAEKIFASDILTLFFDFADKSISKAKKVLRLRKDSENTELTLKKVHIEGTAKVAEEISVQISDINNLITILENVGLSVIEKMKKHRTSYVLDNVHFDIDRYQETYEFIPEFLEIEGDTDLIYKYASLLGFSKEQCLPWSTSELIQYYWQKMKERK
jgi:predicted adenylyl cyclase CyaB